MVPSRSLARSVHALQLPRAPGAVLPVRAPPHRVHGLPSLRGALGEKQQQMGRRQGANTAPGAQGSRSSLLSWQVRVHLYHIADMCPLGKPVSEEKLRKQDPLPTPEGH